MLKESFSNISVRYSPETLVQNFRSLRVQIWVNGLPTWHKIYQNHPYWIPKKQWSEPQRHWAPLGLSQNLHFVNSTTNTSFINSIDTVYTFISFWKFIADSFSATINLVSALRLKRKSTYHAVVTNLAHARKKKVLFRGTSVASGISKINHSKNSRHFHSVFTYM